MRYIFRCLDYRNKVMNDNISFCLYLVKGFIYRYYILYVHGHGSRRSIANNQISYLQTHLIIIILAYFFNNTHYQSSGIRYRIVKFPSSYYNINYILFNSLVIVVGFRAYLLKSGTFKMNSLYGYSELVRINISVIVKFPRRSRQNMLWFKDSSFTILIWHFVFTPFFAEHKSVHFLRIFNDILLARILQYINNVNSN